MTADTRALVERVRRTLERFALWPPESVVITEHFHAPQGTPELTVADLRALCDLAAMAESYERGVLALGHANDELRAASAPGEPVEMHEAVRSLIGIADSLRRDNAHALGHRRSEFAKTLASTG